MYTVYILQCRDGTLYTGCTNNLERRLKAHQGGRGAKYTRSRLPVALVYIEPAEDRSQALRREAAIKRMTRTEKLALISRRQNEIEEDTSMELLELMQNRRSVRQYTQEPIPEEKLEKILLAGLLAPSGRAIRPWELIVVRDRATLEKMSHARAAGAAMLAAANAAVVVIAGGDATDVWCEDCSIVMAQMHLMAEAQGVGSCWVQGRLREAEDGRTTEDYLRDLLGYPDNFRLEAVLSLGMPEIHPPRRELEELPKEKIHREKF